MDFGAPAPVDIREDALPIAAPSKRLFGLIPVQFKPPRRGKQILPRELLPPRQQQGMCLPELSMHRGKLGKLRGEVRSRMQLGVW